MNYFANLQINYHLKIWILGLQRQAFGRKWRKSRYLRLSVLDIKTAHVDFLDIGNFLKPPDEDDDSILGNGWTKSGTET